MALLIDGYNLLHASGILPRNVGPATLERARSALVDFLATAIDAAELSRTTIVFDAKEAPPGLPDAYDHAGMTILFARDYDDADVLLIELIRLDSAPRKLTVVSSDHQVQRAARRRRAKAVDSDRWCAELLRDRRLPRVSSDEPDVKPPAPLTEPEVQRWLREFGDVEFDVDALRPPQRHSTTQQHSTPRHAPIRDADDVVAHGQAAANTGGAAGDGTGAAQAADRRDQDAADLPLDEAKRLAAEDRHLANPFPPGYGEDLLEEDF
jgi:predicted RNA-binding protein with PIN domain